MSGREVLSQMTSDNNNFKMISVGVRYVDASWSTIYNWAKAML